LIPLHRRMLEKMADPLFILEKEPLRIVIRRLNILRPIVAGADISRA
jgi:hypothetical protein